MSHYRSFGVLAWVVSSAFGFFACSTAQKSPPKTGFVFTNTHKTTGKAARNVASDGDGPCIPLTSGILFIGKATEVDSQTLAAGTIPNGQDYGKLTLGGATISGGNLGRTDGEGTIALNLTHDAGAANITGSIQLSALTMQAIQSQVTFGKPGQAPAAVCVSGVSFLLNHSVNNNQGLYGPYAEVLSGSFTSAGVYLYLNHTQQGYALQF